MKLIELTQVCNACGKRKSFKEFQKRKNGRFGVSYKCRICRNIYFRIYNKTNPDKIKKYRDDYRKANPKKMKASYKAYKKTNPEKIKAYSKAYCKINSEKRKAKSIDYYYANIEKIKAYVIAYKKANPEKIKAKNKRSHNKRKLKQNYKLNSNISCGMNQSLKNGNGKNGYHWETLVPYNLNDLIKRLKKTLPKGYKWNDYVSGKANLHIDHIIPIAVHNFKSYTDTDFQRCWALKNLQLLPAQDNQIKHAKLYKHFQPSLLL